MANEMQMRSKNLQMALLLFLAFISSFMTYVIVGLIAFDFYLSYEKLWAAPEFLDNFVRTVFVVFGLLLSPSVILCFFVPKYFMRLVKKRERAPLLELLFVAVGAYSVVFYMIYTGV